MKIGKDGNIELGESNQAEASNGLNLTNEEIIFMYLSTRGAFLAQKEDMKKRQKSAKMIKALLEAAADEDDESMAMFHSKGKTKEEMAQEINDSLREMEKGSPQDPYIRSIYVKLFPYWVILRESAEDIVKEVVERCFNGDNKIMQIMMTEEKLED